MKDHKPIYLDYAAAPPLEPSVLAAMMPYLTDNFYNPSATYQLAIKVRHDILAARSLVASWLGARSSEIIFTGGGTEANNLAIHGIMRKFPDGNLVTTAIEHESILSPSSNYEYRRVSVNSDGRIDLYDLKNKIDDNTVLVSIIHAHNELGVIQPLREIAKIIADTRKTRSNKPIYFHIDSCQAANYLDLHVASLSVDLMTLNGGKIYGPKQSGVLYIKAGTVLAPIIDGGGQEQGLRSGSENVAAIIGFAKAFDDAQSLKQAESERLRQLQDFFISEIQRHIPTATINGSLKYRLANNIHLTLPGRDNERLLIALDEAGIMAAAGSACSASSAKPSVSLAAIGLSDQQARSSLRLSFGRQTTKAMLSRTIEVLKSLA
ncbi:MAG: cysteine desulfurase NifS [Candidatus Saccharimonadales bacterium]